MCEGYLKLYGAGQVHLADVIDPRHFGFACIVQVFHADLHDPPASAPSIQSGCSVCVLRRICTLARHDMVVAQRVVPKHILWTYIPDQKPTRPNRHVQVISGMCLLRCINLGRKLSCWLELLKSSCQQANRLEYDRKGKGAKTPPEATRLQAKVNKHPQAPEAHIHATKQPNK